MSQYKRKDHYWKRAKKKGYRSRSAYKLLEIQRKYHIFRKGESVLDLGCAPGGWLQVISQEVGSAGKVVGVDRLRVKSISHRPVVFIRGDITDLELQNAVRDVLGGSVHTITSDMSPDLTGVRFQDHCRSCELVRTALVFSEELLVPGGNFLAKLFQGEELESVAEQLKSSFQQVKRIVPAASRKASSEIYLLARGFRATSP